jgi:hypothetical protein
MDNIKADLQEAGWMIWIGLIWIRKGTCSKQLQTWWTFWFDKMYRICSLAKKLLASQDEFYSMELSIQSLGYPS